MIDQSKIKAYFKNGIEQAELLSFTDIDELIAHQAAYLHSLVKSEEEEQELSETIDKVICQIMHEEEERILNYEP